MEINTKEEYKKPKTEIKSNKKLSGRLQVKKAEKMRSKIIVYDYNDKLKVEDIDNSLENQNEVNKFKACDRI